MLKSDPENNDIDFYFIIGGDLVDSLDKWYEGEKLKRELKFIIFLRVGYEFHLEKFPKYYTIISTSFVASSSTEIRRRVRYFREQERIYNTKTTSNEKPHMKSNDSIVNEDQPDSGQVKKVETSEKEGQITEISENRRKLESKYLGIYGIVPLCIIEYIKKHNLYTP